jgi:hypothetical protein
MLRPLRLVISFIIFLFLLLYGIHPVASIKWSQEVILNLRIEPMTGWEATTSASQRATHAWSSFLSYFLRYLYVKGFSERLVQDN